MPRPAHVRTGQGQSVLSRYWESLTQCYPAPWIPAFAGMPYMVAAWCQEALTLFFNDFVDEGDGVADGFDADGGFFIHFDVELFLEGGDEFDALHGLGSEVLDEAGVIGDAALVDFEGAGDDVLDSILCVGHSLSPV